MAENTKIEWCTHTFNPWVGCTKIAPPCDHCYAEAWAKRGGHPELWQGERRRTTPDYWQQPLKWNKRAADARERPRVFCASLADVFDNQVQSRWRDDLWHRIDQTPNLDWLLLTKRPQNIAAMLPTPAIGAPAWGDGWPNVWLGATVGTRPELRNLDHLRAVRARIRFLSLEPLLEDLGVLDLRGIHLVITGGETGPNARPTHHDCFRSIRDQCEHQQVAYFHKQNGEWAPDSIAGPYLRWRSGDGEETHGWPYDDATDSWRIGKKRAGALLDGREHRDMPR